MKIAIANDHRVYKLKNKLIKYLNKKGNQVIDLGCQSESSVDYPIYAFELGKHVTEHESDIGIIICGSGIGVSIACNKVPGIRCAKPANIKEAKLSRIDNDANVLALSAGMPYYRVLDIVDAFIYTNFSNLERHQARIDLITEYENKKESKRTRKTEKQQEIEEQANEF